MSRTSSRTSSASRRVRRPRDRGTAAPLLPLGALAAGFGLWLPLSGNVQAQVAAPAAAASAAEATLPAVKVQASAEPTGKEAYQAVTTTVGKGQQALRDIPQSVTVITEKLMDDKNLDTLKAALHSVPGIAFEAGEGGAIGDLVRLRGFSTRGDIYLDGMRDIAQYNRDTFNQDRVEVLRGSASMLYGRGSTGGIINQVSKQPRLVNRNEVEFTAGTDHYYRLTGDLNIVTGETSAVRVNLMKTEADSFRNGPSTDRRGIAPTFKWGIGTRDEISIGAYHLEYDDVPDLGFRWLNGRPVNAAVHRWYGAKSDYQDDSATQYFATYLHRFEGGGELKTTLRDGRYKRDLWATTAGFAALPPASSGLATACSYPNGTVTTPITSISDSSLICRGNQTRAAKDHHRFVQSDYSGHFDLLGMNHQLLAGVEYANERTTTYSYTGTPAKTPITWAQDGGTPDLADTRVRTRNTRFESNTLGLYAQDTLSLTSDLKLIGGMRWDRFSGDYERVAGPLSRTDRVWSHRVGVLYQPTEVVTWYASYGTSFNASGDLYQFDPTSANTPPEKSRNFEVGAKWDLLEGNLSLRTAIFRTQKYNERNTDIDQASNAYLLSGKRHTDGIELEAVGQITPALEVFGGMAWMKGRIDAAGSSPASQASVGRTPGLTPSLTANIWATYRVSPGWRLGLGADGMSSRKPALAETGINRAPGYAKVDALVEYASGPYTVRLNVKNLFDRVYADALYRGFTVPGETRSAQLTVSATF